MERLLKINTVSLSFAEINRAMQSKTSSSLFQRDSVKATTVFFIEFFTIQPMDRGSNEAPPLAESSSPDLAEEDEWLHYLQ